MTGKIDSLRKLFHLCFEQLVLLKRMIIIFRVEFGRIYYSLHVSLKQSPYPNYVFKYYSSPETYQNKGPPLFLEGIEFGNLFQRLSVTIIQVNKVHERDLIIDIVPLNLMERLRTHQDSRTDKVLTSYPTYDPFLGL